MEVLFVTESVRSAFVLHYYDRMTSLVSYFGYELFECVHCSTGVVKAIERQRLNQGMNDGTFSSASI